MFDPKIIESDRWLERVGPREEVVLSTRARYARNFPKVAFPRRAKESDLRAVLDRVAEAIDHCAEFAGGYRFFLANISELGRQYLRENHLVSPEMEKSPKNRGLFLSRDIRLAVMVNEEDHLRMYALEPGFRPYEALQEVIDLETALSKELPFAFSPRFGYLTSCTTNTGTGLRISVMLHLPALSISRSVRGVLDSLHNLGMTARGFYGENTENHGGFFQISNEVTLGKSEREIVDMFSAVAEQIIERERQMRRELLENNRLQVEDQVWRAYAILTHARLLSTKEAMELLALLRLGVDAGFFPHISHTEINKLAVAVQPSHIRAALINATGDDEERKFSDEERDQARAALLRKRLLSGPMR